MVQPRSRGQATGEPLLRLSLGPGAHARRREGVVRDAFEFVVGLLAPVVSVPAAAVGEAPPVSVHGELVLGLVRRDYGAEDRRRSWRREAQHRAHALTVLVVAHDNIE